MDTNIGIYESNFMPSQDIPSFIYLKPDLDVITALETIDLQDIGLSKVIILTVPTSARYKHNEL